MITFVIKKKNMKTLQTTILVVFMSMVTFAGFSQTEQKVETPSQAVLNYQKGVKMMELFRYQEAISYFDLAINEAPKMASAYYYRANCKCNLGLKAEACPDLVKASELGHYVEKIAIPCGCDAKDPKR